MEMSKEESEAILTLILEDRTQEMKMMKNAMKAAIAEVLGGIDG